MIKLDKTTLIYQPEGAPKSVQTDFTNQQLNERIQSLKTEGNWIGLKQLESACKKRIDYINSWAKSSFSTFYYLFKNYKTTQKEKEDLEDLCLKITQARFEIVLSPLKDWEISEIHVDSIANTKANKLIQYVRSVRSKEGGVETLKIFYQRIKERIQVLNRNETGFLSSIYFFFNRIAKLKIQQERNYLKECLKIIPISQSLWIFEKTHLQATSPVYNENITPRRAQEGEKILSFVPPTDSITIETLQAQLKKAEEKLRKWTEEKETEQTHSSISQGSGAHFDTNQEEINKLRKETAALRLQLKNFHAVADLVRPQNQEKNKIPEFKESKPDSAEILKNWAASSLSPSLVETKSHGELENLNSSSFSSVPLVTPKEVPVRQSVSGFTVAPPEPPPLAAPLVSSLGVPSAPPLAPPPGIPGAPPLAPPLVSSLGIPGAPPLAPPLASPLGVPGAPPLPPPLAPPGSAPFLAPPLLAPPILGAPIGLSMVKELPEQLWPQEPPQPFSFLKLENRAEVVKEKNTITHYIQAKEKYFKPIQDEISEWTKNLSKAKEFLKSLSEGQAKEQAKHDKYKRGLDNVLKRIKDDEIKINFRGPGGLFETSFYSAKKFDEMKAKYPELEERNRISNLKDQYELELSNLKLTLENAKTEVKKAALIVSNFESTKSSYVPTLEIKELEKVLKSKMDTLGKWQRKLKSLDRPESRLVISSPAVKNGTLVIKDKLKDANRILKSAPGLGLGNVLDGDILD